MSIGSFDIASVALRNLSYMSSLASQTIQSLSTGQNAAIASADSFESAVYQSQLDSLNQAASNSQDAVNLIKTADGGLSQVSSLLNDIHTTAIAAANTAVSSPAVLQAYQAQINGDIQSIQSIASQTQFNGKSLLDGSAGISASLTDTTNSGGVQIGSSFGGGSTESGAVSITVNTAATQAASAGNVTFASTSSLISSAGGGASGSGGQVVINGQSIAVTGSDTVQTLIDKINLAAGSTGVSAGFTSANGSGSITLTQQNFGASYSITETESAPLINSGAGTTTAGQNAVVSVTANVAAPDGTLTPATEVFTGGTSVQGASGVTVSDAHGNSITLTSAGNSTSTVNQQIGSISSNGLTFQTGIYAGQSVTANIGNVQPSSLGTGAIPGLSLNQIDVSSAQGAQQAIAISSAAITHVASQRADLGALQSQTLQSTLNSLQQSISSLSATNSHLSDTDYGKAITQLNQQLFGSKAALSVLSRINFSSNLVLSLLK